MRMRRNPFADGANSPSALSAGSLPPANPFPSPNPDDQDAGGVAPGVDEDALNADDLDTDRITSPDE